MAEISPLRRRMIEDMTVRNLSPATQRSYLAAVSKFSRYFGRSPDRLHLEDVRAIQVYLVATGISWPAPLGNPHSCKNCQRVAITIPIALKHPRLRSIRLL